DKAHSLYMNIYMDEPIVDVLPLGENATIKHAANTNRCVISLTPIGEHYLHITSVTDNLLKGTSSQALQCFNLMFGFDETLAVL
ncbi:MAG: N-acetyl-gamma-glutamyl-phosphate reductase, partial [Aggregatilineales bacterium]